jgi:hypothetical protein
LASRCFLVGLFTTTLDLHDAFNYFAQQDLHHFSYKAIIQCKVIYARLGERELLPSR